MYARRIILVYLLSSCQALFVPSGFSYNESTRALGLDNPALHGTVTTRDVRLLPRTNAERIRARLPLKAPTRRTRELSPRQSGAGGPPVTVSDVTLSFSVSPGGGKKRDTSYLSCGFNTGCTLGTLASATVLSFSYIPGSSAPFSLETTEQFYIGADYSLTQSATPGDIGPGTANSVALDGVTYTEPDQASSNTKVQPESSIWIYDPASQGLTPQWINSGGTAAPATYLVAVGNPTVLKLTGDVSLSGGTALTVTATAAPTPVTLTGYLGVHTDISDSSTLQGYVACVYGGCTIQPGSSATGIDFTYIPGVNAAFSIATAEAGAYIGADYSLSQSSSPGDIDPGSSNTLNLDFVSYSHPGTESSDTSVQFESSIWTYNPSSSVLTPQWINHDGSSPPTTYVYKEGDSQGLRLTGDIGLTPGIAVSLVYTPNVVAVPDTVTLSGYIAAYTNPADISTLQGYVYCDSSCSLILPPTSGSDNPSYMTFTYTAGDSTPFSLFVQESNAGGFYIGANNEYATIITDIGPGSTHSLTMYNVAYSAPGTKPVNGSFSSESSIWTYDSGSSTFTPHWVNSDGSTPTTYVGYHAGSGTYLHLTGDLAASDISQLSLVYTPNIVTAPSPVSLSGYIAAYTNPADASTLQGYVYCDESCNLVSPSPSGSDNSTFVNFTYTPGDSTPFSIAAQESNGNGFHIGANNEYATIIADIGPGSTHTVVMYNVVYSAPGTKAVNGSFSSESSIWTYDSGSSILTPHWVNSDGSTPTTYVGYYPDSAPDLHLTGDVPASDITQLPLLYTLSYTLIERDSVER